MSEKKKSIFALRLAKLRKEKELSQYKLAEILGYSRGLIGNYEQGSREPDHDTLKVFADFFNVSVDYLIGISDQVNFDQQRLTPILKEEKDIDTSLEEMKKKLMTSDGLMFDGQPATEDQIQAILNAIEMGQAYAKQRAKEKFTPKKYRK